MAYIYNKIRESKWPILNLASGEPIKIKSVIKKVVDIVGSGNQIWGD